MKTSEELFERAERVLPGGVNSPVRACRNVGATPRFLSRADGAYVWDVEGRRYIDYICSWGPMILGHNHPAVRDAVVQAASNGLSFGAPCEAEVEMAELLCALVPGLEMVRMVCSGTEAVMSALRLARGATGRPKILKFEGCYHGHSDGLLVKAGSGAQTFGAPDSAGVPPDVAAGTLVAPYNDLPAVEALLRGGDVACVVVEPVAANMGVVPPAPGFLAGLRALCDRYGALLIFDEVITGFRLGLGGAQAWSGVHADLVTYGKIIGGGMPVGAYGGSRDLMRCVAPTGPVYQAGTLSGNPVAMAAGLAQLRLLAADPAIYDRIDRKAARVEAAIRSAAQRHGVAVQVNRAGSLLSPFFTDVPVTNFQTARTSDLARFAQYWRALLAGGVYAAPSQFEAMFLSDAHDEAALAATETAIDAAFKALREEA